MIHFELRNGVIVGGPLYTGLWHSNGFSFSVYNELVFEQVKGDCRNHHPDTGCHEPPFEISWVPCITQASAHQRREECTKIDSHIENCKCAVHPLVARR